MGDIIMVVSVMIFCLIGLIWSINFIVDHGANFFKIPRRIRYNWKKNKEKNETATLPKFTAEQFKTFYSLNPEKWRWPDVDKFFTRCYWVDPPVYDYNTKIWFTNSQEMYKAWKFYTKAKKDSANSKAEREAMLKTAKFLEVMKREADNAQRTADKMMLDTERELNEVLSRIQQTREGTI